MATTNKKENFGNLGPWSEPAWSHGLASPYYNDSHRNLRDALRSYIDENILPHQLEWEEKGEVPTSAALKFVSSGFAFNDVPTQYRPSHIPNPGGVPIPQLDAFHFLIQNDESSRVEGGIMSGITGSSVIGIPPIIHHGTEAQKRQWLPGLFTLETRFCLGITEPSGGSDVANIQTTAVKSPDGKFYVVNGLKKWITGSLWATHMTTAVRTGGGPGAAGISVLVIPLSLPGITLDRIRNSGQNAGGTALVGLDDVYVPAENLIGGENQGFKVIMVNFNRERFLLAIACNRKARTCLTVAFEYACRRKTFGKALVENQVITTKFANIARDVEAHWAWLEQIAYAVQKAQMGWLDPDVAGRIALCKVSGGRLLESANREAQQVLGGAGYQRGGDGRPAAVVEQISRDLRMNVVGGGSEEIISDLAVRQERGRAGRRGWRL